jgi:hypothetical protein
MSKHDKKSNKDKDRGRDKQQSDKIDPKRLEKKFGWAEGDVEIELPPKRDKPK